MGFPFATLSYTHFVSYRVLYVLHRSLRASGNIDHWPTGLPTQTPHRCRPGGQGTDSKAAKIPQSKGPRAGLSRNPALVHTKESHLLALPHPPP